MYLPHSPAQLAEILEDLEIYCRHEPLPEVSETIADLRWMLHIALVRAGLATPKLEEDAAR